MTTEERVTSALRTFSFLPDVHVVGGAVRDMLAGRNSDDIDLATSATPKEVANAAREMDMRAIGTGVEHGTVTILEDGNEFEITTFRRDVSTDGRNATVEFADDIEEDLKRRDFTINAMAARLVRRNGPHSSKDLEIVDPFDGKKDLLENHVIRTVGNPRKRFKEDFLRIVRAFRFSSRFRFRIGREEMHAIDDLQSEVSENVSVERVVMEVKKAMKDENPEHFLTKLVRSNILSDFLEEDFNDDWVEIPAAGLVERPRDRMLMFLRGVHLATGMEFDSIKDRLRLPNDIVGDAESVSQAISEASEDMEGAKRRFFLSRFSDVLDPLARILVQDWNFDVDFFKTEIPLDPIVTGQDFINEGFNEGPLIGKLVKKAHDIQLEEGIVDRNILINRAKS